MARQILLGEMEANATDLHPAGLARGQRDFVPVRVVFPLEGKRLAGFYGCDDRVQRALIGSHINRASGIVDDAESLGQRELRKDEREGDDKGEDSPGPRAPEHGIESGHQSAIVNPKGGTGRRGSAQKKKRARQ